MSCDFACRISIVDFHHCILSFYSGLVIAKVYSLRQYWKIGFSQLKCNRRPFISYRKIHIDDACFELVAIGFIMIIAYKSYLMLVILFAKVIHISYLSDSHSCWRLDRIGLPCLG